MNKLAEAINDESEDSMDGFKISGKLSESFYRDIVMNRI